MYSEELRSKCGVPEPLCIARNSAINTQNLRSDFLYDAEYRSHYV